jgi:hypothetical protein
MIFDKEPKAQSNSKSDRSRKLFWTVISTLILALLLYWIRFMYEVSN